MAHVDLDRIVRFKRCRRCPGAQDLRLNGAEAGIRGGFLRRRRPVNPNGCMPAGKQRLQVACRPAPSLQQLVLLGVIAAVRACRDVGPEIVAWTEQEQVDVHRGRGNAEHLQE